MAATPEQEQLIKVETTRILLDKGGQGVTPKKMKTITVAREIADNEVSGLEELSGFAINLVILDFGPPYKVKRSVSNPSTIQIDNVLDAHDSVTDVHRSMAVEVTSSQAVKIQDAADIAEKAVEILEQALATVKELYEKAVEAADEASENAEKAKKAGEG